MTLQHPSASSSALTRSPDEVRPPRAVTPLEELPAGQFRASLDQDLWWWSSELYAILGHREGSMLPTTEVFLHHVDPEQRAEVRDRLFRVPVEVASLRVRVRTTRQRARSVVLTTAPDRSAEAQSRPSWLGCSVVGTVADVTVSERHQTSRAVHEAILHRDVVEQAKGITMSAYGLDEDRAFLLLTYFCHSRRLAMPELARQLVDQVAVLDPDQHCRRRVERVLSGDRVTGPAPGPGPVA